MSRGYKLRSVLCGALIGVALLCLFFSTFAAVGCAIFAILAYPARRKRGKLTVALLALIAILLIVLGVVLAIPSPDAAPESPAPTDTAAVVGDPATTAEPVATISPLDTDLTIYPTDVPVEYASTSLPLTADILDGSTVPNFGTVFYVDGTVSFEFGYMLDALYLESDFGEILALNYRIVYDGIDVQYYTAHTIPDYGETGRFILTYAAPSSDGESTPILLYGANERTIDALAAVGESLKLKDAAVSPTEVPKTVTESSTTQTATEAMSTYICNTSSMVFHRPSCSAVKNMADYNKQEETCYASTLIAMGYSPCSKCNPN